MLYDQFLFSGGLQQAGKNLKKYRDHDIYGIEKYDDLLPILGPRWHIRVFNEQMDFSFTSGSDRVEEFRATLIW